MKIRYSQIEIVAGNPQKNFEKCLDYIKQAKNDNVNLLVFPECVIPGYMLGDKLEEIDFIEDCEYYNQQLAKQATNNFSIIFGSIIFFETLTGKKQNYNDGRKAKLNVACIATDKGLQYCVKTLLPNYSGFDEKRHFANSEFVEYHSKNYKKFQPIEIQNKKVGITICEDIFDEDYDLKPATELTKNGAEIIINILYCPFRVGKRNIHYNIIEQQVKKINIPLIFCSGVGLQNNGKTIYTFDGISAAWNKNAKLIDQADMFVETYKDFEFENGELKSLSKSNYEEKSELAQIHEAIIYGIRKYMAQSGLKRVVIGASGGVDSTLAAGLYAEAIGKENLLLVNMPTKYNSKTTIGIAEQLAKNIGCWYTSVPIGDSVELTNKQIDGLKPKNKEGKEIELRFSPLNLENIQARDRGSRVLAAISSAWGGVFTNNGNKTENTVGYATLYGDVSGFLGAIGDLWKHTVYDLCRYINEKSKTGEIIPKEVLTIVPSAELSVNQDVEAGKGDPILYPYHDRLFAAWIEWPNHAPLQEILQKYLDGNLADYLNQGKKTELTEEYIKQHFPTVKSFTDDLERWQRQFKGMALVKRVQAPPILKVTNRCYGADYRDTITDLYFPRGYRELKEKNINK